MDNPFDYGNKDASFDDFKALYAQMNPRSRAERLSDTQKSSTDKQRERSDRDQALGEMVAELSDSYVQQSVSITKLQTQVEELKKVIASGSTPGNPGPTTTGTLPGGSLFGDPHKINEYTDDFEEWQWKIRARLEELKDCDEKTKICYVVGRTTGTVFDSVVGCLPSPERAIGGRKNSPGLGSGGSHVRTAAELLDLLAARYVAAVSGSRRR